MLTVGRMRIGAMAVLLAAFGTARAGDREGVCARANWVCVAQCIDRRCADKCLRGSCEQELAKLKRCAGRCEDQCTAVFGTSLAAAPPEPVDPCAGIKGAVPRELIGTWKLSAASMEPVERRAADPTPQPRPDYAKTLRIAPNGCFVLELELGAPTLGEGNRLVVLGWGTVTAQPRGQAKLLAFQAISGRVEGDVCGQPRAIDLAGGEFRSPVLEYELRKKDLYLTRTTPDRQTFDFTKEAPPRR